MIRKTRGPIVEMLAERTGEKRPEQAVRFGRGISREIACWRTAYAAAYVGGLICEQWFRGMLEHACRAGVDSQWERHVEAKLVVVGGENERDSTICDCPPSSAAAAPPT